MINRKITKGESRWGSMTISRNRGVTRSININKNTREITKLIIRVS